MSKQTSKPSATIAGASGRSPQRLGRAALGKTQLFLVALVLIGGAAGLVYGRAIGTPFVFDDPLGIQDNPSVTSLWPLIGDTEHPGPLNPPDDLPSSGRPLVNFSLAVNYALGELNPVGYHAFNLVMHVVSALLLMAIVWRTLSLDYFGGRFEGVAGWLSLAVALLWALHPLQTETVVYVTQRTELMVGFFYLATLYGSLRYWNAATPNGRTIWLMLSTVACLAGMACKEVMVTAPVVVLLFERTFIGGSFRQALRKSWPLYCGLVLSWVLLIWLNHSAPRSNSAGFHLGVTAIEWWLTQSKVFWMYLRLAVWPWPLAIHYEMPYLTSVWAAWPWLVSMALACMASGVFVWRRSAIAFASAWVLIILSPTLVVPILTEVAAERRMYLPLAALVSVVIVGSYAGLRSVESARAADNRSAPARHWALSFVAAVALILAVVYSTVSIEHLAIYRSSLALWQDTAVHQPEDPLVQFNLANHLKDDKQYDEAIGHYEQALRFRPNYPEALNNLGSVLARLGRRQEAIEHYQMALRLRPDYSAAENNWGEICLNAGQLPEAIEHFQKALKEKSNDAEVHYNLGNALKESGHLEQAIGEYEEALREKPKFATPRLNLGVALAMAGRSAEAIEQFQRTIAQDPQNAEAYNNLGYALASTGRPQEAIDAYMRAIQVKPDYAQAWFNLAHANADTNHPNEAVTAAEKTLALARTHGQTELARQVEAWLKSYRAKYPNPPIAPAPTSATQ